MMTKEVKIEGLNYTGFEVPLPQAPLVGVYSQSGFVMCGYLNVETADTLGISAAMVRGVNTIEDVLKAPVQAISKPAEKKGVRMGMTGQQALACLG